MLCFLSSCLFTGVRSKSCSLALTTSQSEWGTRSGWGEKPFSFCFLLSHPSLSLSPSQTGLDNPSLAWSKPDGRQHNPQHPSQLYHGPSLQLSFYLEHKQISSFPSVFVTVSGRTFCRARSLKPLSIPQPGSLPKRAFFPSSPAPGHMAVHPASTRLAVFSCACSFRGIVSAEEPLQQMDGCAGSTWRELHLFLWPALVVKITLVAPLP